MFNILRGKRSVWSVECGAKGEKSEKWKRKNAFNKNYLPLKKFIIILIYGVYLNLYFFSTSGWYPYNARKEVQKRSTEKLWCMFWFWFWFWIVMEIWENLFLKCEEEKKKKLQETKCIASYRRLCAQFFFSSPCFPLFYFQFSFGVQNLQFILLQ